VPVAVVVVAILVVCGLTVTATAAYFELKPTSASPGTVTVTDDLGRTVAVPADPTRVAVLSPSITDSMVDLGLRDRIVAVDCYAGAFGGLTADYTASQIAQWNLTSSMCVQAAPQLSIEQLLNATPDLVLVSTIVSESAIEEVSTTYHLPVLVLQPSTLGGIIVDVELLAQVFHVGAPAESLVAALQTHLAQAASVGANLSANGTALPTVMLTYYADSAGYWTYGPGTFGDSLISLVSAVSISAGQTLPYPEMSGPQVLVANPWGIIYAVGFGVNLTIFQQAPYWSSLSAVGADRVWGMDSTLLTEADPTMILEGIPQLLGLLHPTAVG
jgi:iron complex transport system substrate-binding protein